MPAPVPTRPGRTVHGVTFAIVLLALVTGAPAQAQTEDREASFAQITRDIVDNHVRPGFERFQGATGLLLQTLETHCAQPSPAGFGSVEQAFRDAALAFARIEYVDMGPMRTENRRERVLFWPDPRSRGMKQVQKVLATGDETATSASTLARKSVALQGLGALEFLLYGTPSQEIKSQSGAFACRYATAIAGNLEAIAGDAHADWMRDDGFAGLLLNPGAENAVARSHQEAAEELLTVLPNALEAIRDQKIVRPLGADVSKARHKRAPYWRSGLTVHILAANISGLHELLEVSGVQIVLPEGVQFLVRNGLFGLSTAESRLEGMDGTVETVFTDPDMRGTLTYLTVVLGQTQKELGADLFRALDLTMGFNRLDGD